MLGQFHAVSWAKFLLHPRSGLFTHLHAAKNGSFAVGDSFGCVSLLFGPERYAVLLTLVYGRNASRAFCFNSSAHMMVFVTL